MNWVRRRRLTWASCKGLLQLYHAGWSWSIFLWNERRVILRTSSKARPFWNHECIASLFQFFIFLGRPMRDLAATFKGNSRNASDNLFYLYKDSPFWVPSFCDQGYEYWRQRTLQIARRDSGRWYRRSASWICTRLSIIFTEFNRFLTPSLSSLMWRKAWFSRWLLQLEQTCDRDTTLWSPEVESFIRWKIATSANMQPRDHIVEPGVWLRGFPWAFWLWFLVGAS